MAAISRGQGGTTEIFVTSGEDQLLWSLVVTRLAGFRGVQFLLEDWTDKNSEEPSAYLLSLYMKVHTLMIGNQDAHVCFEGAPSWSC